VADALAIDGGTPVRSTPLPRWPAPGEAELAAVTRVVASGKLNYWTGTEGRSLETEYATLLGRAHGVAVANGTLALELALRAFSIGAGDEVVVPARTFIATASAVVAVGATPVVCDVDPESGNLTADNVVAVLGARTRAIIPVHVGGWPVDMDPLVELARARHLVVIEDCAQAHGGTYRGRPVGSLGSHAAAFSFCHDKIVSAGEGGMLVLDDDAAYERAWAYKDHGKSLAKVRAAEDESSGTTSFRWLVDSFGSNWRIDEFSAAMARVGTHALSSTHEIRTANGLRLAAGLAGVRGLRVPMPPADIGHAFYRLYTYVRPEDLAPGWDRDRIARAIAAEGVACGYGTCCEIYREQAFAAAGLAPETRLPVAAQLHETSLAFPVHPTLGASDIDDIASAVAKVMKVASR